MLGRLQLLVAIMLTLGVSCPAALAAEGDVYPEELTRDLIRRAQEGFWGRAELSSGAVVEPADEAERRHLLIPDSDARRIVKAGIPAGLAMWCDVPWEGYFQAFMAVERRKPWTEKQIAFIGVLFGVSQGFTQKTMKASCPSERRSQVRELIDINTDILKKTPESK